MKVVFRYKKILYYLIEAERFLESSSSFVAVTWTIFVTKRTAWYFHLLQLYFPDSKMPKKPYLRFYANKSSFQFNSMSIYRKGYWHFGKKILYKEMKKLLLFIWIICHWWQVRFNINLNLLQWRRQTMKVTCRWHDDIPETISFYSKKTKNSGTVLYNLLAFDKILAPGVLNF